MLPIKIHIWIFFFFFGLVNQNIGNWLEQIFSKLSLEKFRAQNGISCTFPIKARSNHFLEVRDSETILVTCLSFPDLVVPTYGYYLSRSATVRSDPMSFNFSISPLRFLFKPFFIFFVQNLFYVLFNMSFTV